MILEEKSFREIAAPICRQYDVDMELLLAIAIVESNLDCDAVRYEPTWSYPYSVNHFAKKLNITRDTERINQSMSWGLLQLIGTVLRECGYEEPMHKITHPAKNIKYGCIKLKEIESKFPNQDDMIAAYHAGYPKKTSSGDYVNQYYVNKVKYNISYLKNPLEKQ